jgi:hypothetical protein
MVKNTTGGTGAKSLARKHQVYEDGNDTHNVRMPSNDLEKVAIITKMLGNGMCEVYTNDDVRLIAHIRNKFRGKNKRHNLFAIHMFVLVGLREWENPPKNCDIIFAFHDFELDLSSFANLLFRKNFSFC